MSPSVYVPVAVNCSVKPLARLGSAGVTAIEVTTAGVTVSVVVPLTVPSVTVMVEEPVVNVEAKPLAEIVATTVFDDAQATVSVRFCVEPSLYVPVAVNCSVSPFGTDGLTGVNAIDFRVAARTVSVVEPTTLPSVAVIVVAPVASVEARPVVEIVAAAVFDDAQMTEPVRFCVVPSVKVPVAVNCWVSPLARLELAGVTAMEATTAGVTVSVVVPLTLPSVAMMVEEPVVSVEARPLLEIVTTVVFDDVQLTDAVRFAVVPSV